MIRQRPAARDDKKPSRTILLDAAARLMSERGTTDISLGDIAKQAQLNSALVKYYFGSKNGLLLACAQDVLGRSLEQMEGLVHMDLSPVEKLKLHIRGIINVYFRYPFINRLIHLLLRDPETARIVATTISQPLAETQRKLLEQGVESGLFKPVDPMHFYFILIGACDHLFFGQHTLRHAFDIDRIDDELRHSYTDTLLDLVLRGILNTSIAKEIP